MAEPISLGERWAVFEANARISQLAKSGSFLTNIASSSGKGYNRRICTPAWPEYIALEKTLHERGIAGCIGNCSVTSHPKITRTRQNAVGRVKEEKGEIYKSTGGGSIE